MGLFSNICAEELLVLATISTLIISNDLDANDLNVLGTFFSTVGDSLQLLAAQKEYLMTEAENNSKENRTE